MARVEEGVGVSADPCAADHGINEVDPGPDEPDEGAAPRERLSFAAEEEPIEDVEQRDEVVEEDVGYLFRSLWVPNVTQKQGVAEADYGDVNGGGGFQVGVGAVGSEGYPGTDTGDKQIAEDGEEAAIADEDRRQVEAFGEGIGY